VRYLGNAAIGKRFLAPRPAANTPILVDSLGEGAQGMDRDEAPAQAFREFVEIIRALRAPGTGCPWDLEQDHQHTAAVRP